DSSFASKPYDHPLYRGLVLELRHEFKEALKIYEDILKEEPEFAIIHCRQGFCYFCLGDYQKAIEWYTSAIKLKDDISTVYYNRAIAYEDLGNELKNTITDDEYREYLLKAVDDYNKTIELEPDNVEPVNNRGLLYYYLGEHEKAITDLTFSIEMNSTRAVAYDFRGCALRELGNFDEAIIDHARALELDPTDPIIYFNRALVWIVKGEIENAVKDLKEALKLEPNYTEAKEKLNQIIPSDLKKFEAS
ncbi:MAG: tetratricopeptide repeat protein, partial [Asgard group archaeon]|nr:tetratricopeptide repeat protein [Asgard group archaeon]